MFVGSGKVGLFTSAQMFDKQASMGWQVPAYQYHMADAAACQAHWRPEPAGRGALQVHDPTTGACVVMRAAAPKALAIKDPNFNGEIPPAPLPSQTVKRDRFDSFCAVISQAQQKLARKRGVRVDPLQSNFNALNLEVVKQSQASRHHSVAVVAQLPTLESLESGKALAKDDKDVNDTPSTVASAAELAFGVSSSGSDDDEHRSASSTKSSPEGSPAEQTVAPAEEGGASPKASADGLGDFFTAKNKKKLRRGSSGGVSSAEVAAAAASEAAAPEAAAPEAASKSALEAPATEAKRPPWKARSLAKREGEAQDADAEAEATESSTAFDRKVSFEGEAKPAAKGSLSRAATEPVLEGEEPAETGAQDNWRSLQRSSTQEVGSSPSKPRAWQPMKRSQAPLPRPDELRRQVQSLLNKICPENLSTICERISKIDVQSPDELEIVMGAIFKKALADPHYSEAYADLVASLKAVFPEFPGPDGEKPVTFKSSLLNICQAEFESLPTTLEPSEEEREQCGNDQDELDFQAKKKKDRMLANMKFIGQLFLRKLVASKVLGSVMQDLLCCDQLEKYPEDHAVECVCELLYSVGLSLEANAVGKHIAGNTCGRLLELSKAKADGKAVYSKRVQFAIQELLQTRAAGWARKTFKSIARTKEAIRREQERDEKAKENGKSVTGAVFTFAGLAPDAN